MSNDERLLKILEQVVNIYIKTGEPVGSAAICNKLNVSSATVRAEMVKLEKLGLLEQPHVSAGRVPTYDGFRIYINRLMKLEHLSAKEKKEIDEKLKQDLSSVNSVVDNAVVVLSQLTGLAAVSTANFPRFSIISRVEVIPTGKRVYAILVITSTGEIKNKICRVEFDIDSNQLNLFKKMLNDSLIGSTIDSLSYDVIMNLSAAIGSYVLSFSPLFKALYEISDEMQQSHVNLKGEDNLLKYEGVQASEILQFISTKDHIEQILSTAFSGISVVFGKENDIFQVGNSSLIMTKYGDEEKEYGSFGVIGPIRLNYRKVMAYVKYFENSISGIIKRMKLEEAPELEDGKNKKEG